MFRWAEQAEAQEGTVKRQEQIFAEMSRFVERQAPPLKAMDPNEQRLKEAWESSPQSHKVAKDWCEYQALKRLRIRLPLLLVPRTKRAPSLGACSFCA